MSKANQKLFFAILSEKQGDTIGSDKRGKIATTIVGLAMDTGIKSIAENFSKAVENWDESGVASCHLADDIHFIVSTTESGRNIEVNRMKTKH